MSSKSVASFASFVIVLAALTGCGAPPDTEADDEGLMAETGSALSPRDDLEGSRYPRLPSFERPIWDLTP